MIINDNMDFDYLPYCPVCRTKDIKTELQLYRINLTDSVYLCQLPHCTYPEGYSWILAEHNKTASVKDTDDEFDPKDYDTASETDLSEISQNLGMIQAELQAVSQLDNVWTHLLDKQQKQPSDLKGFAPSSNTIESESLITTLNRTSDQLKTTCNEVSNSLEPPSENLIHSNEFEISKDVSVETKTKASSNPIESKQIMAASIELKASSKDTILTDEENMILSSNKYNLRSKPENTNSINKPNRSENIKYTHNTDNYFKELIVDGQLSKKTISDPHCSKKDMKNELKIDKISCLPSVENKPKLPGWQGTSKETQKKITCTIDSNFSLLESSQKSAEENFKFGRLNKEKKIKTNTTALNNLIEARSNPIVLSGLDGANIKTVSSPNSIINKGSLKEAFVLEGLKYESKSNTIQFINKSPTNQVKIVSLNQLKLNLTEKIPAIKSNVLASVTSKENQKTNIIPGCKTNTEFRYHSEIIKPATKTHLNQCEEMQSPEENQAVADLGFEDLLDNMSKTEMSYPKIPVDQSDIDDWLNNL